MGEGGRSSAVGSRVRGWASRLPLRVRLVAGFVVAITVVLTLAGAFVHWRVTYALDRRLDADLRADAAAVTAALDPQGRLAPLDSARTPAARRYQLVDDQGRVLASGTDVGAAPLLTPAQARAARTRPVVADIGEVLPISRRPLRLLAEPVVVGGRPRVLVVADRRDQRDEALRELLGQLAAAGLAALVVTAVVGERLAHAALAPVERYRTQAASIAAGASGVRLDVPPARDDEVTRLGHTLNDVLDALERALAHERQFTQDASHELRTPLTLLSARIQLTLRRPRSTDEHVQVLRELRHDVDALAALAERLLALSTAADGGLGQDGGDLSAVVADVVREDGAALEGAVLDSEGAPLPVALPEPQLRQVLGNLLGNARTHGSGEVRVRVRSEAGTAVLTVSDDGPAVDPGFLPVAADRFARSELARARPGAGLGLSLVRTLVEQAGGELRLCSHGAHHRYGAAVDLPCTHPGRGTTASVLLPLVALDARSAPSSDLHV